MPGLTCNACNKEFHDETEQKLHYKSEWHRYNLKRKHAFFSLAKEKLQWQVRSAFFHARIYYYPINMEKVAGVPGVTEDLFLARQSALAEEKKNLNETPMLYSCGLCGKSYRSSKAHAQHLQSKSHLQRASQGTSNHADANAIIKPLPPRVPNKLSHDNELDADESDESEWEEVDPEEDLVDEATDHLTQLKMTEQNSLDEDEEGDSDQYIKELDPSCCFMCDLKHGTIESCMVHMHKQHGFYIPDVEYLKDPKGLLTYLGLKVRRDYTCIYCNDQCRPFGSLEAVRKHMEAKSHCKVHYGDGGDDEEAELEEFYDYSNSYKDADGKQLVVADDAQNRIEFGSGGSELIITRSSEGGMSTRVLGSREFLRYYRQKPRPMPATDIAITAAIASRYRSMGLATVQSREHIVKIKALKAMNRSGVEAMRSKIGMKSNVIRNLPKNVTH